MAMGIRGQMQPRYTIAAMPISVALLLGLAMMQSVPMPTPILSGDCRHPRPAVQRRHGFSSSRRNILRFLTGSNSKAGRSSCGLNSRLNSRRGTTLVQFSGKGLGRRRSAILASQCATTSPGERRRPACRLKKASGLSATLQKTYA